MKLGDEDDHSVATIEKEDLKTRVSAPLIGVESFQLEISKWCRGRHDSAIIGSTSNMAIGKRG